MCGGGFSSKKTFKSLTIYGVLCVCGHRPLRQYRVLREVPTPESIFWAKKGNSSHHSPEIRGFC